VTNQKEKEELRQIIEDLKIGIHLEAEP